MKKNKKDVFKNGINKLSVALMVLSFLVGLGAAGNEDARDAYNDAFYATGNSDYDIAADNCGSKATSEAMLFGSMVTMFAGLIGYVATKEKED